MSLKSVFRGWLGEKIVGLLNWAMLNGKVYRQLNNITLELPDGTTTQIDHLVVSIFGIFVIETKNMSGWIYGGERDSHWTQCFPNGKKFRFQNPIKQNYRHQCSIIEFLNARKPELNLSLDDIESRIFSVVFFGPDATVKTEDKLPDGVNKGSITFIKSKTTEVFTADEVEAMVGLITDGKLPSGLISGGATRRKHLESLQGRHNRGEGDACPKCGESLVSRQRKSDGSTFVGCSSFPKCRYIVATAPTKE